MLNNFFFMLLVRFVYIINFRTIPTMSSTAKNDQDRVAVENFRSYLKIPSVHPNVNYGK